MRWRTNDAVRQSTSTGGVLDNPSRALTYSVEDLKNVRMSVDPVCFLWSPHVTYTNGSGVSRSGTLSHSGPFCHLVRPLIGKPLDWDSKGIPPKHVSHRKSMLVHAVQK